MDILSLNKVNKLGKEFDILNNDYNIFKERLDFIKGVIATESELPLSSNDGDVFFIKNSNKLVKYDILTNGYVDLSSSGGSSGSIQEIIDARNGYPNLKTRLDVLESQFAQDVKIYTEEFKNNPIVDTEKTNAIVGHGYVKVGKTATVNEEFNDNTQVDLINSASIKLDDGKVTLDNALNGIFMSKEFVTAGTDYAIINPIVNHYSDMAFSQVNNIANRVANSQSLISASIIDRTNRLWIFYGGSNGLLYYKVFNSDGSIAINESSISGTQVYSGNQLYNIKLAVDYNNRIWVGYPHIVTGYANMFALNSDGTIFKAVETMNASSSPIHSVFVDRNNKVWYFFYASSNSNLKIYNADGTVYMANTTTNINTANGYGDIAYDSIRDKIILIGTNNNSTNNLTVVIYNLDGTVSKVATTISNDFAGSPIKAFYDQEIDKIVLILRNSKASITTRAAFEMVWLDPVSLAIVNRKDFGNIAKNKTVTASSYNGSTTIPSYIVDLSASNGWASTQADKLTAWIKLDLGSIYKIKLIKVLNGYISSSYSTKFTVAISTDDVNYTDVATITGLTGQVWTDIELSVPTDTRYIKIYNFDSNTTYAYLGEVEVYEENSITDVASAPISVIKDGNIYKIAFVSNKENATYTNIHYCEIRNDFTIVRKDTNVTSDVSYNDNIPNIYKHPDGTLRIMYSSNRLNANYYVIDETIYTLTPTQATYKLSNDGGLTWVNATPGQQVAFPTKNNRLKVRIDLSSPLLDMTPELLGYTVQEWSADGPGAIIGEFVTTTLPTTEPAVRFTLTANQLLNGGTIEWYISNDGGLTWIPVTLGQQTSFPNPINADVRIKAVINSPMGQAQSPVITEYKLVTSSTVMFSDFNNLQINLMKTNFKLDSIANTSRNAMKNLIIDTFNDTTGIDDTKSTYVFDDVNKCVKSGTVVSVVENLLVPPQYILLTVDEKLNSGSIAYYVSRDNGVTWSQINPNVKTDISSQPANNKLVVKAVITGDAELSAWAYAWS